jgi:hypothetical protein
VDFFAALLREVAFLAVRRAPFFAVLFRAAVFRDAVFLAPFFAGDFREAFRAPLFFAVARLRVEVPFFAVFRRDVAMCAPLLRGDGVDDLSLASAFHLPRRRNRAVRRFSHRLPRHVAVAARQTSLARVV